MPKTINDIIPPSRRKAMQADLPQRPATVEPPPPPPMPPAFDDSEEDDGGGPQYPRPMRTRRSRGRFPYGLAIGALVVVAGAAGVLHAFAGAKVEVTPVVNQTTVSGEFVATASAGDLPFSIVTAETVASVDVPAEGTTEADDPAQGVITVYNAQDKAQQLIKNTRFESPQGLIFRIRDSITVPAGTATDPGELKVTVYADEGGERYNIGPSSFTVPGLAGSATYDLVYARSAEPMTGGFSGVRPSVGAATKAQKYEALKPTIDAELATALAGQVPEGYVLLPGASWTSYVPQPDVAAAGTVSVRQKGIATAVVFPESALAKAIAFRTLGAYDGQPVTLGESPTLALTSVSGTAPATSDQNFSFSLLGGAKIIWEVDPAKISGAVAGKSRDAARTVLLGFPEVEKAYMVVRPFWAGGFPADPADIEVEVADPEAE